MKEKELIYQSHAFEVELEEKFNKWLKKNSASAIDFDSLFKAANVRLTLKWEIKNTVYLQIEKELNEEANSTAT